MGRYVSELSGMISIPGTNKLIAWFVSIYSSRHIYILTTSVNQEGNLEITLERTINSGTRIESMVLTNNNEKIIIIRSNKDSGISYSYSNIEIYNLNELLNIEDGGNLSSISSEYSQKLTPLNTSNLSEQTHQIWQNIDGTKCIVYGDYQISIPRQKDMHTLSFEKDLQHVIGLKYNGNYFYRQDPHILTAGQPDVRAGKTFIGWMGTQETGTMEVSEE